MAIVTDDFNLPGVSTQWATLTGSTVTSIAFCDCVFKLNVSQVVLKPTHSHGNTFHLIMMSLSLLW